MAGFLSKSELEALVAGSVQTGDLAPDAVTAEKIKDGEVKAGEIGAEAVTKPKLAVKEVSVTVAAGGTSGSSDADPELVGGEILGYFPAGNQDQFVADITLNADGSITITLAAAATADNTFKVIAIKP